MARNSAVAEKTRGLIARQNPSPWLRLLLAIATIKPKCCVFCVGWPDQVRASAILVLRFSDGGVADAEEQGKEDTDPLLSLCESASTDAGFVLDNGSISVYRQENRIIVLREERNPDPIMPKPTVREVPEAVGCILVANLSLASQGLGMGLSSVCLPGGPDEDGLYLPKLPSREVPDCETRKVIIPVR